MAYLSLVEYHSVSAKVYSASGNTLVFNPSPRSIKKDISVKWRVRRAGYEKKIERSRFRYNEKITFTVTGSCPTDKRNEIEWFVKRDSLFLVQNLDLKTYHAEYTSDSDAAEPSSWAAAKIQGEETVYVIIEKSSFTQREAKVSWYDYVLTLRRVHLTRH